jgi:hypothetical protein
VRDGKFLPVRNSRGIERRALSPSPHEPRRGSPSGRRSRIRSSLHGLVEGRPIDERVHVVLTSATVGRSCPPTKRRPLRTRRHRFADQQRRLASQARPHPRRGSRAGRTRIGSRFQLMPSTRRKERRRRSKNRRRVAKRKAARRIMEPVCLDRNRCPLQRRVRRCVSSEAVRLHPPRPVDVAVV